MGVWRWAKPVVILMLLAQTACGGKMELYRNLPPHDANAMLALLMRHGIEAERTTEHGGTASLLIPAKDVPRAMSVLDADGWPRDRFPDLGTLFKKEGMISSPTEERVRFIYGATQGLSETLSKIDGVLNARVHSVLPEAPSDDRVPSAATTAAVLIRYKSGSTVHQSVPKIKELVANSLKGLSYDRVSVTLVEATEGNTGLPSADAGSSGSARANPSYLFVGLVGGFLLSLICNAVLAVFAWRNRALRETMVE